MFYDIPEWFKHQTQMLFVVKVSEQTETVELVIRVCIIQLLQKFQFLQSSLVPKAV